MHLWLCSKANGNKSHSTTPWHPLIWLSIPCEQIWPQGEVDDLNSETHPWGGFYLLPRLPNLVSHDVNIDRRKVAWENCSSVFLRPTWACMHTCVCRAPANCCAVAGATWHSFPPQCQFPPQTTIVMAPVYNQRVLVYKTLLPTAKTYYFKNNIHTFVLFEMYASVSTHLLSNSHIVSGGRSNKSPAADFEMTTSGC